MGGLQCAKSHRLIREAIELEPIGAYELLLRSEFLPNGALELPKEFFRHPVRYLRPVLEKVDDGCCHHVRVGLQDAR